jgi:PGF-CTERM protein
VLVVAILLFSAVGTTAATTAPMSGGQAHTEEISPPAFVVALAEDGSAEVAVTYTFDLSDDTRQAAFEEIRNNETASESFESRFRQQLAAVANDAGNETGREMSITDVDIAFETEGETGIVRLTATWEGLAATDGDQLTVTEPFASGFEPDRTFVVVLPEGYAVESVSPAPQERANGQLTRASGSHLSGFELTASPDDTTETESADGDSADGSDGDGTSSDGETGDDGSVGESGPGFGLVVAVLGVLGAALLAARR